MFGKLNIQAQLRSALPAQRWNSPDVVFVSRRLKQCSDMRDTGVLLSNSAWANRCCLKAGSDYPNLRNALTQQSPMRFAQPSRLIPLRQVAKRPRAHQLQIHHSFHHTHTVPR